MKRILLFLFAYSVTYASYGQSTEITPGKNEILSDNGDNITIKSNSFVLGLQSLRFNGTLTAKTPVLLNDDLLRLGAGGYYNSTTESYEKALISLKAAQNWSSTNRGTKIQFSTTQNNGSNLSERMIIDHDGEIGIGTTDPQARFHINHLASPSSPTLHLQSNGSSSSFIRTTSTAAGIWENHFLNSTLAGSNLVYWTNSVNSTIPLTLTGEGDAFVERNVSVGGFTNLGSGAPKIKMKELSGTFSSTTGSNTSIAHGLSQSKILSVQVFVNASTGNDIGDNYPSWAAIGFEYSQYLSSANVILSGKNGNDASLLGRPIRILITYKE